MWWFLTWVFIIDNMVEDMDVDLDKEFLQELKELKILITDKDLLDQHKRSQKHKSLHHLLLINEKCFWRLNVILSTLLLLICVFCSLCLVWSVQPSGEKLKLLMRWRLISRWETWNSSLTLNHILNVRSNC